jgi:hypothetical protein
MPDDHHPFFPQAYPTPSKDDKMKTNFLLGILLATLGSGPVSWGLSTSSKTTLSATLSTFSMALSSLSSPFYPSASDESFNNASKFPNSKTNATAKSYEQRGKGKHRVLYWDGVSLCRALGTLDVLLPQY